MTFIYSIHVQGIQAKIYKTKHYVHKYTCKSYWKNRIWVTVYLYLRLKCNPWAMLIVHNNIQVQYISGGRIWKTPISPLDHRWSGRILCKNNYRALAVGYRALLYRNVVKPGWELPEAMHKWVTHAPDTGAWSGCHLIAEPPTRQSNTPPLEHGSCPQPMWWMVISWLDHQRFF